MKVVLLSHADAGSAVTVHGALLDTLRGHDGWLHPPGAFRGR